MVHGSVMTVLGRRPVVGVAVSVALAFLAAGCGGAVSIHAADGHHHASVAVVAKTGGNTRLSSAPADRVVGTIRAVLPAQDNVIQYKSILLAAYRKACPDVTAVSAEFRPLHWPRSELIVVQCGSPGSASRVAVRVVFTGVRVPDMLGLTFPDMQGATSRIGLRLRVRHIVRNAEARVIRQNPRPGTVVSFGTTVTIVVASDAS